MSGKISRTSSQIRASSIWPGAFGIDVHAHRLGNADGVGQLHFAAIGQAGGDDVLGHVAGHVGGAAIDLGRVLAAERAAAVPAPAAVGVDDDLAAGQAAVAVRAADDELAGRVDVVLDLAVDQVGRQQRLDDLVDDELRESRFASRPARAASRRRPCRSAPASVAVEFDRDLALAVGPQPIRLRLVEAGFGQPIDDPVSQRDRQRHQLRRVVAGVAEHQALVAGADVLALRSSLRSRPSRCRGFARRSRPARRKCRQLMPIVASV